MSMIEVQTAKLIGPALDWAVAKADEKPVTLWDECCGNGVTNGNPSEPPECCCNPNVVVFCGLFSYAPSTDWSVAGRLIDQHVYAMGKHHDVYWCHAGNHLGEGPTILIAACRAIVAAKLGDDVMIPSELVTT